MCWVTIIFEKTAVCPLAVFVSKTLSTAPCVPSHLFRYFFLSCPIAIFAMPSSFINYFFLVSILLRSKHALATRMCMVYFFSLFLFLCGWGPIQRPLLLQMLNVKRTNICSKYVVEINHLLSFHFCRFSNRLDDVFTSFLITFCSKCSITLCIQSIKYSKFLLSSTSFWFRSRRLRLVQWMFLR